MNQLPKEFVLTLERDNFLVWWKAVNIEDEIELESDAIELWKHTHTVESELAQCKEDLIERLNRIVKNLAQVDNLLHPEQYKS